MSLSVRPIGLCHVLLAVVQREMRLGRHHMGEVLTPLAFFAVVACLFALGVGPQPALLRQMAPGVLWVSALLSVMLTLPRLFASDYADGSLETLLLSSTPLGLLVLAKVMAHCVLSGLPLVLMTPVLGLQFGLDSRAVGLLMLSLLLGMPTLSLMGSIGAALTLGVRGAGVLLSLITLPLTLPVLIFGAGMIEADAAKLGIQGHVSLLAALMVLSLFFTPLATSAALRIALE